MTGMQWGNTGTKMFGNRSAAAAAGGREDTAGKGLRIWLAGVLLVLLTLCAARTMPAYASEASAVTGSVEFQLPAGQSDKVELSLVAVGTYTDQKFVLAYEGVTVEDLSDASQAQEAAEKLVSLVADYEGVKNASAAGGSTVSASGLALGTGASGKVLTGKADADGLVRFTDLAPGMYLVLQTAGERQCIVQPALVPLPYIGASGTALYDASLTLKYTIPGGAVILTKVDDAGNAVAGASFVLQEKVYLETGESAPEGAETGSDAQGSFYWKEYTSQQEGSETVTGTLPTNAAGQIAVEDLPLGTYRFVETAAPAGYILKDNRLEFTISASGQVVSQNARYVVDEGQVEEVSAENPRTRVIVNKVDEEGNSLDGAVLTVKDSLGNTLKAAKDSEGNDSLQYKFTSTSAGAEVRGLPEGSYYLSELTAPSGYSIASDVRFWVTDKEEGTTVTMVDTKQPETPNSLTVKKKLYTYTLMGSREAMEITAATFYVALFEDAQGTTRCSDVIPLAFRGAHSQTATFKNLTRGKTYYVFETDEAGNIQSGAVSWKNEENNSYTATYPNGQAVTVAAGTDNNLVFENEFLLPPLDGNVIPEPDTEKQTDLPDLDGRKTPDTEKPNVPGGGNGGNTPGSSGGTTGGSTGGNVRTGDETPIGLIAGVLGGSAAVIIILIVVLVRRRKKR